MSSVKAIREEVKLYIEKADVPTLKIVHAMLEAKHKNEFLPDETGVTIEQYNREIDEAMAEIDRGEFYTNEEVKKMFAAWDKKQLKRSSGVKGR